MATKQSTASTRAASAHQQQQAAARPQPKSSEGTAERIRAFLSSVRPIEDIGIDYGYISGRDAIEGLAASCPGGAGADRPTLQLTTQQAANVVEFLWESRPRQPATWWAEPTDGPNHVCGWQEVMFSLERCLEAAAGREVARGGGEQAAAELDAKMLERRLSEIKTSIWRACGVIACVMAKLGAGGEDGIPDAMNALEMVHQQLSKLADTDIDTAVREPASEVQS